MTSQAKSHTAPDHQQNALNHFFTRKVFNKHGKIHQVTLILKKKYPMIELIPFFTHFGHSQDHSEEWHQGHHLNCLDVAQLLRLPLASSQYIDPCHGLIPPPLLAFALTSSLCALYRVSSTSIPFDAS